MNKIQINNIYKLGIEDKSCWSKPISLKQKHTYYKQYMKSVSYHLINKIQIN